MPSKSLALLLCLAPACQSDSNPPPPAPATAGPPAAVRSEMPELEMEIIPLANASAQELTTSLRMLYKPMVPFGSKGWSPEPVVVADFRTNSLIVRASKADLDNIKALIATLDRRVEETPRAAAAPKGG